MAFHWHHIFCIVAYVVAKNPVHSAFSFGIDELMKFDADRALTRVLEFIIDDSKLNRCVILHEGHHHPNVSLNGILRELQANSSVTVFNMHGWVHWAVLILLLSIHILLHQFIACFIFVHKSFDSHLMCCAANRSAEKIRSVRRRAVLIFFFETSSMFDEQFLRAAQMKSKSKLVLVYRHGMANETRWMYIR